MQSGIFRLKHPTERRPGLPRRSALVFWPAFVWETLRKHGQLTAVAAQMLSWYARIQRDPAKLRYVDLALTPVADEDEESFDFMTKTTGAKAALAHIKKVHELTHAHVAAE